MFEDALVKQMKLALEPVEGEFTVTKEQGRVYVFCPEKYDFDEAVEALQRVFGIVGMVRACFLGTVSVDLVWNVCMGAAVIGLSIISKGAVGMGDGLLFLSLGTVLSFEELLSAFLLGLFCCCFWGIVVLFLSGKGKKTEMPFVPFLMLGYIGGLIY